MTEINDPVKTYSPEEREALVSEWSRSGQSRKSFAQSYGLNYNSFKNWVQKALSAKGKDVAPSQSFVAIQIDQGARPFNTGLPVMEVGLANGAHISFYQVVPADYLRDLLK